jgi:predicted nucleotidyltransferase
MLNSWNVVSSSFMNVEHIFPTQQKDIADIIAKSKECKEISKIIIFGSSVTWLCNPWSDIDIYFELESNRMLPSFGISDTVLDKWTNFDVDEELLNEIMTKGVVVYER